MARMVAIWCNALFEVRLGSAERVAALADRNAGARRQVRPRAWPELLARWFRGWADARMGKPREGYELIREAYEANTRLGMLAGTSEILGYAAEALLLAGDLDRAASNSTKHCESPTSSRSASICRSCILSRPPSPVPAVRLAVANASVRRAVAEARNQGRRGSSSWLYSSSGNKTAQLPQDRRALAVLVDRLPEATDTQACVKARALLDKTQALTAPRSLYLRADTLRAGAGRCPAASSSRDERPLRYPYGSDSCVSTGALPTSDRSTTFR